MTISQAFAQLISQRNWYTPALPANFESLTAPEKQKLRKKFGMQRLNFLNPKIGLADKTMRETLLACGWKVLVREESWAFGKEK